MKSPFALPSALATLLLLSACGQTGPLTMPKPPHRAAAQQPVAAPSAAGTAGTDPAEANTATAPIGTTATPPAPAAGVVGPSAGSNANNTQATTPASQQQ